MGLKFDTEEADLFLGNGQTIAFFHSDGKNDPSAARYRIMHEGPQDNRKAFLEVPKRSFVGANIIQGALRKRHPRHQKSPRV